MTASSTSSIGMLSRTGYTRWHSPHFRLSPVSLSTSGFLQTGQTSMSRRSWGIMADILRQIQNRLVSELDAELKPAEADVTLSRAQACSIGACQCPQR